MVVIAVPMFHPQSFISSDCVEHLNFFTCSCCVPLSILHIFRPHGTPGCSQYSCCCVPLSVLHIIRVHKHLDVPSTAVVVFHFQSFTSSGPMEHLDVPSTTVVAFRFQSFTSSEYINTWKFPVQLLLCSTSSPSHPPAAWNTWTF